MTPLETDSATEGPNPISMLSAGVNQCLAALRIIGAPFTKYIGRNTDDTPLYAVIVVSGPAETADIVKAVEEVEESWGKLDEDSQ